MKLQKLRQRHENNFPINKSTIELQRCEIIEAEPHQELDPSLCFSPDAITPTVIYESSTPLRMAEEHQATISIHEGALELESECLNVLTTEISTPLVITMPSVEFESEISKEYEYKSDNSANSVDMLDTFSLSESITTEPDPTCCICNAIPPSGTELKTCDSCDNLLCGHCALSHTFPHDSKCKLSQASLHEIEEPPDRGIRTADFIPPDRIVDSRIYPGTSMTYQEIYGMLHEIHIDLQEFSTHTSDLRCPPS